MNEPYTLINNEAAKRYELQTDGEVPFVEYIKTSGKIFLTHTEVPKPLEGKGFGSALIKLTLEDIDGKGLTLVPLCPFVAAYIKRHPEWKRLVLKGVNIE
jgi:predicted GNAT family acetyltransferase